MTFRKRLTSKQREDLYDAEAEKARESGRGELPICNICDCPIDGRRERWNESHDPTKPRFLGGEVTGIAHQVCNFLHNNQHDTPLYAKSARQRQKFIGANISSGHQLPGGRSSPFKLKIGGRYPVDRVTGEPWRQR